jgi:hypothetical protein
MACSLSLYEMVPDVSLEGKVLTEGALNNFEIAQCIKDVTEARNTPGTQWRATSTLCT